MTQRVAVLAEATREQWGLQVDDIELLKWAGALHEIGVAVSQEKLLPALRLPGTQYRFARVCPARSGGDGDAHHGPQRQTKIRAGGHRKRKRRSVARMMVLLRLAVMLKHVEALEEIPDLSVSADDDSLTLAFPQSWGDDHPLTVWEIEQGAAAMEKLGVTVLLKAI